MPARLTVITGPPGADVGPVTAIVGAGLDDGFAIRVLDSATRNTMDTRHRSPNPHHRRSADGGTTSVMLDALPAAWQDPLTNLGVVWTGAPDVGLRRDIEDLEALGLNPSHRVTVQWKTPYPSVISSAAVVPPPVEVGDVGTQARDSVLRSGGQVLVEAGDGMTSMQALTALNLPPWATWVHQLDLWVVLDVRHAADLDEAARQAETAVHQWTGGAPRGAHRADGGGRERLRIAVYGLPELLPELTGVTDGAVVFDGFGSKFSRFDDQVMERTGGLLALVHTGATVADQRWLDLRAPGIG